VLAGDLWVCRFGRSVHRVFASQGQLAGPGGAFIQSHVEAFAVLGRVPADKIHYDKGTFTGEHEAFWSAARRAHGDAGGTRALVEVLLHRHLPATDVIAGLAAALEVGATTTADLVGVEAREAHQTRSPPNPRRPDRCRPGRDRVRRPTRTAAGGRSPGGEPHRTPTGRPSRGHCRPAR